MFWTKSTPKNTMPQRTINALKANFNDHELSVLSRVGTAVDVKRGTELTVEGDFGQQALIMIDGAASVSRNGETIAIVGPGEIIGEIALLTGEPRMATVVTETDATVYAMSPRDFASLLARCPRLEARVASTAVRRLAAA